MEKFYKKSSFFLEKRIFLQVQTYNLYVRKKLGGKMEIDLPESVLEELQKVWKQQWKKLTLADDFIFSRIMQNTEVCKEVLELLLKIKISKGELFPLPLPHFL